MTRQLPTCLRARLTLLTRPHLLPLPMLRRVNLFMNDNKYALQMQDITVEFPGVLANDHVSIDCKKGEVLGLLGENGAGKTTLMNVLYGLYPPSSGKILLDGREVQIGSPSEAISYGVGMVHQHFKLVDTLSVIENVILGIPTKK